MPAPEFFQVTPVADALKLLDAHWQPQPRAEIIATADALGRILAADLHSPEQAPAFRKSTVDGYALRAADSFGATQSLPAFLQVRGELKMGQAPQLDISAGEALLIHTGGMLPASADAVVMVEQTQSIGGRDVEVLRAVAPGENVIQAGEDVMPGAIVLPRAHRLRPQDIGGALAVGITEAAVLPRPRVGILSCGDELAAGGRFDAGHGARYQCVYLERAWRKHLARRPCGWASPPIASPITDGGPKPVSPPATSCS